MLKNLVSKNFNVFKFASIQIISKGLTLLSTYAIALYATNEVFGYISLLQATMAAMLTIFGFNLPSGVIRYYFERKTIDIFSKIFPIVIILFVLSIIASAIIFSIFIDHNFYVWFSILPFVGFLNGCILIFSMLARANNKIKLYAISELARPLLLIVTALLYIICDFNIVKYFSISLITSSILAFSLCFILRRGIVNTDVKTFLNNDAFTTKEILIYTVPLFFVQLMSLMNNVSDKFIMTFFLNVFEIGIYGKAYLIGSSLGLLFDSLMLLWVPYVVKNKYNIINTYLDKMVFFSALILVFSFIIFIISILVVYFYFGGVKNIIVLSIIIVSAFISRIGYQILTPLINAFDKTRWVANISFISMFLGLVFNLLLIPNFGIVGAAVGTFLSFFTYSLMSIYLVRRLKKTNINFQS